MFDSLASYLLVKAWFVYYSGIKTAKNVGENDVLRTFYK